jgi:iron complex outermembrane receptor protein
MKHFLSRSFLLAALTLTPFAWSADQPPAASPQKLKPVVIKGTSIGGEVSAVTPSLQLSGTGLESLATFTLGDLLADIPGFASSYFGPNAGRPIVRGLEGDRVKITQNGTATLDASSVSPDHAISADPLTIRQIEVLRGPAGLLYSTSILGGVINLIDNRVPVELQPNQVTLLGRIGSVDGLRATSILAEGSVGNWAYHVDGFHKTTDNLTTPVGVISDTASMSDGAGVGFAYVGKASHIGFAYSGLDSSYGVSDPGVLIGLHQRRWDIAGAVDKPFDSIKSIEYKLGISDYHHSEYDNGIVGTTFSNKGWDGRVDVAFDNKKGFEGVVGLAGGLSDFTVVGDEAFLPITRSKNQACFGSFTHRLADSSWKLRSGFRLESDKVSAQDWTHDGIQASHPAESRSFSPLALSVGAVKELGNHWETSLTLSRTERAPNMQELYADGPHLGTNAYEVGSRSLETEKAVGLELELAKTKGPVAGSVSVYYNRFSSYVSQERNGFGPNLTSVGGGDYSAVPRYDYVQIPADLYGAEAKTVFELGSPKRKLEFFGDYVRGRNHNTGEPLPRLSPGRLGVALAGADAGWDWRIDCTYHLGQHHLANDETSTAGYAMVGASFSYPFKLEGGEGTFGLRLTNLFDSLGRDASSFLKDTLPMPGRGVEASVKLVF